MALVPAPALSWGRRRPRSHDGDGAARSWLEHSRQRLSPGAGQAVYTARAALLSVAGGGPPGFYLYIYLHALYLILLHTFSSLSSRTK